MGRGLLAGAFWGGLLGALLLLVAALVLETRKDLVRDRATVPEVAQTADPAPPDTAPVLLRTVEGAGLPVTAPDAIAGIPVTMARRLLPRPMRPDLPMLAAGRLPDVLLEQTVPPAPKGPEVSVAVSRPDLPGVPTLAGRSDVTAPLTRPADAVVTARPPQLPAMAAVPGAPPAAPLVPKPLIVAQTGPVGILPPVDTPPGLPALLPGPPPDRSPKTAAAEPIPAVSAPPLDLDRDIPARADKRAGADLPEGAHIAFVLDAGPDAAVTAGDLPEWVMTATQPDLAPAWIALAGARSGAEGQPVLFPDRRAPSDYVAAELAARPALLAYDRLTQAGDATSRRLSAIAARARRDGAVTVLVAADPTLWGEIDRWLADRGAGLQTVPATAFLP